MIENLRHVRSFLAVARIGNFTRASAELHISQSALTVQIKQLESDLGVTLFDRGKRRVVLTRAGQDIFMPLQRILIDAEEIASRTSQIAGLRKGIVAMAVLPTLATRLIPEAISRFLKLYPDIVIQVSDVVNAKVIEAVKKETVDFGIGSISVPDRELKSIPLLKDHVCAFIAESNPIGNSKCLTLKQLVQQPLILTGPDSSVRKLVESAFKRDGLILDCFLEANYISTALGMAQSGLGIALLPESASRGGAPGLRRLAVQGAGLSRKIDILMRTDRVLSPAAEKMVIVLKELARSLAR